LFFAFVASHSFITYYLFVTVMARVTGNFCQPNFELTVAVQVSQTSVNAKMAASPKGVIQDTCLLLGLSCLLFPWLSCREAKISLGAYLDNQLINQK
jgi:hypothetical protein